MDFLTTDSIENIGNVIMTWQDKKKINEHMYQFC